MKTDAHISLKESVLFYLDQSGGLLKLSEDCKRFDDPMKSLAVYRFCISVNPTDVIELDPSLGDLVLHNPLTATSLFQSVCFLAIKTLSLIQTIQTESQVNVILRLTHLPLFPEYILDISAFPRGYGPLRPVSMEGLVVAMSRVTKYTQGARFLCSDDGCSCSEGFSHIRVHVPGATESATVRNDFSCHICESPLKEDVKFRVLGDKQLVEIIHVKALDVLSAYQQKSVRYQSVTLFLRDELCNSMRIGRLYRVIGIPAHVYQWPHITCSVEANSIQPWVPEYPLTVSESFQSLVASTACSPWRFSAVVAHCFGLDVAPPGLYNTLKFGLLLSLVQTRADAKEDTFHNLDVLVLATDTLIQDRLMTHSLRVARRGIRHKASGEMFACLSRDEHGAATANIHAGSALLATGGICMLGDLGCYKKEKLEVVQTVLESRAVSVFIPGKKYGEDAGQQLSFPVQCSFWALTDTTDTRRSSRMESAGLGAAEMGPVPAQLAELFGLVIHCRDPAADQALQAQTLHTLQQATQPDVALHPAFRAFSTQDYQQLVAHAQSLQVELSQGAEMLIHGYFMASRRIRSHQGQGVKIAVASVKLLVSLAEAHCRLGLRTEVLEEDAVIAVLLCENSITLKHGASALLIPPDTVFACDLCDVDGLHKRDLILEELHQNILRFIYSYAPGAAKYITED